jgi:hypothetical protein
MYTYVHVHVLPFYLLFIDIEKIVGHFLVPHLPISLQGTLVDGGDMKTQRMSGIYTEEEMLLTWD